MSKSAPDLPAVLRSYRDFHPVVMVDPGKETVINLSLAERPEDVEVVTLNDIQAHMQSIITFLQDQKADYAIGGYDELRSLYARSAIFNRNLDEGMAATIEEPRRLHIGVDVWGNAGTPVYAALEGTVHSKANNDTPGDYGATIILKHEINGHFFHTLYGHLSLADLDACEPNAKIRKGQMIGHFGIPAENGHWPPHLHFQVIEDMGDFFGDYPGVCKLSERQKYLSNCPDPELILNLARFVKK